MKRVTAFEALMYEFGYTHFKMDAEEYPFIMRLVDWEKALNHELKEFPSSTDKAWKILRKIGFVKQRVLQIVDPALIPIIDRMLDLPILTLSCCSGHPHQVTLRLNHRPFLEFVFRESRFGRKFVEIYNKTFKQIRRRQLKGCHAVSIVSTDCFGVELPLDICLSKCLPIYMSWRDIKSVKGLQNRWCTFSRVLDAFDGKGVYTPSVALLGRQDNSNSTAFLKELTDALQKADFMETDKERLVRFNAERTLFMNL